VTFDRAYNRVANGTLWFVAHLLHDLSRAPTFDERWRREWASYTAYDGAFANALAQRAAPGEAVLVQDYHLSLTPRQLREQRPDLRIGHFSHTPWAPPEVFGILPDEIVHDVLTGLLGADAVAFLKESPHRYDWLYLDPARRDTAARKIFLLRDCEPDVAKLLPLLLHKADKILLKTSPMLDIEHAVQGLGHVRRLWVVAVDNEVKEVLYELGQEPAVDPERYALNLRRDGTQQEFRLNRAREARATPRYAEAQQYLYEPNAAVLKAGAFRSIGTAFELLKLHQHSHLYTSDVLRADFPGRVFRIRAVEKADGAALKAHLGPEARAHVTTRNFPDSVADFRRRTGIREGGEVYLFATTDLRGRPVVLVCEKLTPPVNGVAGIA